MPIYVILITVYAAVMSVLLIRSFFLTKRNKTDLDRNKKYISTLRKQREEHEKEIEELKTRKAPATYADIIDDFTRRE